MLVLAIDYIFVCDYIQEICILSQLMAAFEISWQGRAYEKNHCLSLLDIPNN